MASKKEKYPVLPLRDIVVYPKMIVPLFVGREKSIRALQEVVDNDKNIVLATQKNAAVEEPVADDIYHIGTLGTILQLLKLPDGTVKVLIEGLERVKIEKFEDNNEFMEVTASVLPEKTIRARKSKLWSGRFCHSLRNMSNFLKNAAGSSGFGQPDYRLRQAGGYDCFPSVAEDCRQAGAFGRDVAEGTF